MLQYPGTEANGHATRCQLSCVEEEEEGEEEEEEEGDEEFEKSLC